jgi:hypothetical protein
VAARAAAAEDGSAVSDISEQIEAGQPRRSYARSAFFLTILGLLLVVGAILLATLLFRTRIGPAQPIPFSHRVHAHDKQISCYMCHEQARFAANAGVPPVQTCLLCHSHIIVTYPPIEQLRCYFDANKPVEWTRVTRLPDFVYFTHAVHLQRGVDCGRCHGNVLQMDRIQLAHNLNMGFCMRCHRENRATVDCFTCHR